MKSALIIWAVRHNIPTFLAVREYSIPKKPRPCCGINTFEYCSIIFHKCLSPYCAVTKHNTK
ncbi:unknown [Alistipes sp. CAG:831]|nr:unknown [Alistipes sp. CAG:831]